MAKRKSDRGEPVTGPLAADFSEFERPTREDWRRETERSLKGAPIEKKLVGRTVEGFSVQPIHDEADLADLAHEPGLPGYPPWVRGCRAARPGSAPFLIAQSVDVADPAAAGLVLEEELGRGLTAIRLALDPAAAAGLDPEPGALPGGGAPGIALRSAADLALVLGGADLSALPLQIVADETALGLLALVAARARAAGTGEDGLRGCVAADPLGRLARAGRLHRSLDACYRDLAACAAWAAERAPGLRVAAACGTAYADGGASAVEELGCVLAAAVEYLRALGDRGIGPATAARAIHFEFSVGSDFFAELTKLRAARLLWGSVLETAGAGEAAAGMSIHACTGRHGKTVLDPHVNMLRATTEAFAAVAGGADSVETLPYDALWRSSDEFSRRVARNAQIVLRDEAGLGRVTDPGGGSWYVEWLTDRVAREAWELFREIEGAGGMAAALAAGLPQRRIAATAARRREALGTRAFVLVGTNQYADPQERAGERRTRGRPAGAAVAEEQESEEDPGLRQALERLGAAGGAGGLEVVELAIAAARAGATLGAIAACAECGEPPAAEPVRAERLAEPYERLRRRAEAHEARTGAAPTVFLAGIGPLSEHKARADFSAAFFQPGGFRVISGAGFETPEAAAEAAAGSGARAAVLCSVDDNYPRLVPPFVARLREAAPGTVAVLAGYPRDQVEAHRAAGIDEFVHLKADNLELLQRLFERLGVE